MLSDNASREHLSVYYYIALIIPLVDENPQVKIALTFEIESNAVQQKLDRDSTSVKVG
jgi:hypothetical protein